MSQEGHFSPSPECLLLGKAGLTCWPVKSKYRNPEKGGTWSGRIAVEVPADRLHCGTHTKRTAMGSGCRVHAVATPQAARSAGTRVWVGGTLGDRSKAGGGMLRP